MTTIKVVTKYSPEMIKQFDMHSSGNAIGNHVERIIMLREQGVQEALSKLGYLNPEEAAKQQERITQLIKACELISSVIAKHSYRNEDGANIVNILDIEPQCQLIDTVLEATKQEGGDV